MWFFGLILRFTAGADGDMVSLTPMNCPDCGTPVEKEAQFCPKCFSRIEPPTFWQRLIRFFQGITKPTSSIIKINKTVTIKTVDKDGQRHEYHSVEEAPPELRSVIENLQSQGMTTSNVSSSSEGGITKVVSKKTVTVFKVRDASGNERVYHSLEELPPEIRAAMEKAQKRADQLQ